MKAPEISQELKGDLQVLKMRGSLDPKRFYKKNDRDGFPKYFQVSKNCSSSTLFSNKAVYTFIFPARVCSWKQLKVDLFICNTHRNNTQILIIKLCSAFECNIFMCVCDTGWYGGGQPCRLLSFPCSQEGQEENHGGGAVG